MKKGNPNPNSETMAMLRKKHNKGAIKHVTEKVKMNTAKRCSTRAVGNKT